MNWKLWWSLKAKCVACSQPFATFPPCQPGDFSGILERLYGSQYHCPHCRATFHGKCGQSSLRSAGAGHTFLICPSCRTRFRHVQPDSLPE